MRPKLKPTHTACLIVLAALAGCIIDEKEARRGSVVENEVAGTLFDKYGQPVAGATVKVLPVDYVPKGGLVKAAADSLAVRSVKTGEDGRYVLDSLPAGEYNILGEFEGAYSYLDSIAYSETLDSLPSDTLRAPGALTGYVRLEPNHDPRSVFIQVLGTNVFANADGNGRFTLREMAGGEYSLRILSILDGYTPAFPSIRIRSGAEDTLEAPIPLIYTGIPVVRSLEAAYDTATETTTLRWPPADYAFLREYLVFRSPKGALHLPTQPIARVRDTVYSEPVSHLIGPGGYPAELEYRVRVSNLSDSVGPAFAMAEVRAMPRESIAIALTIQAADSPELRGAVGDTVPVVLGWQGSSRQADSLEWTWEDGRSIRSVGVSGLSGSDTAYLVLPGEPGPVTVRARLLDRAGDAWEGALNGWVEDGLPAAKAGSDTEVTISDTVRLRGSGEDRNGRIVKLEWDIGNTGTFVEVESGDTTVIAPAEVSHQYHVLRVTDDDGNVDLDTVRVTARDDRPLVSLSWYIHPVSKGGGYLLKSATTDRGRAVKWEWDFGDGVFVSGPGPDTSFRPTAAAGTTLDIRVRVTDDDGNQGMAQDRIPVSKWEYLADLPSSFDITSQQHQEFRVTAMDGKLYVLARRGDDYKDVRFASFEPATGKWTPLTPPPYLPIHSPSSGCDMRIVGGGGKIFQFNSGEPANRNSGILEFDLRLGEWVWIREAPVPCWDFDVVAVDSIFYLVGMNNREMRFHTFNLASGLLNEGPTGGAVRIKAADFLDGLLYATDGLSVLFFGPKKQEQPCGISPCAGGTPISPDIWEWQQAESLPVWVARPSLVAANGKLYAMGQSSKSVYQYDRALNTWTEKSPMLWYSGNDWATELDGMIYSIGDRKIQRYDPASEP